MDYGTELTDLPYADVSSPGTFTVSLGTGYTETAAIAWQAATATSIVTLSSSLNPSTYGAQITFTAAVPSAATGTITFYDGSTALSGAVTITGGSATYSTSALAVGSNTITASYSGDSNYPAATSNSLTQTVNQAAPTVSAWPTASAINYGQTLASSTLTGGTASMAGTFAWTTSATTPGAGTPSESVTFTPSATDYSTVTGSVNVTVNKAVLTVTATNASVAYDKAIPTLKYTIAGYVNGDTSSVVSGAPVETTTATQGSAAGTYPITITQGTLSATNYGFQFVNGTLTIGALGTTATPTFKPAAGTYTAVQKVTISDATAGAAIYFTTNGSTPTTSSTPYTAAITVSSTETVKAIAVAPGYAQSAVASAAYTINLPTAAPTFTPAAGTYTSAQMVTIADATTGAAIYYTTNGSTPTTSSTPYTAAITVSSTETVKAIAVAPGYAQSAVASAAYTIATAPSVTTKAATGVSTTGATLSGTVTANNATTQYWFAYGISSTSLTSTTTVTSGLTGTSAKAMSATLTGLKASTTYYFRAVASNAVGTTSGAVLSFTTK